MVALLKDVFWWTYAVLMDRRTSGCVLGAGTTSAAMHKKVFGRISGSLTPHKTATQPLGDAAVT